MHRNVFCKEEFQKVENCASGGFIAVFQFGGIWRAETAEAHIVPTNSSRFSNYLIWASNNTESLITEVNECNAQPHSLPALAPLQQYLFPEQRNDLTAQWYTSISQAINLNDARFLLSLLLCRGHFLSYKTLHHAACRRAFVRIVHY